MRLVPKLRTGFTAAPASIVGTDPYSVVAGDFNGDQQLDLAVASSSGTTISVLLGNGTGSFGASTPVSAGASPFSVVVGDFNGDGKLDIVTANAGTYNATTHTYSGASVSVLLGDGTGGFKAIPVGGWTLAHALATGRSHPLAEPFGLERFITGRLIDEAAASGIAH